MQEGQLLVVDVASVPEPALMKRAQEVAAALKLNVFIGCVRDESDLPPPLPGKRQRVQDVRAKLLSRCRHALERRLDALRSDGLDADGCVKRADSVKNAVLDLVQERSPVCVMMLRRPHTRFEQATLGGDDFAVIRACPAPVWLVNPSHSAGDKIIGALGKPRANDGPSLNDRILDFTTAHGLAPEHAHIYEGKLERVLEEESEPMNADLIVVGASTDGRLKRMVSGGTTERIIQHVDTDVLVLKNDYAA